MNVIIGVSDMKVSNDPRTTLVTYSLGSCIGVAIYDPMVKVGGMLHYMLPESDISPEKALKNPFMFADTGIPCLFKAAYQMGAQKPRLKVVVAGASQVLDQKGFFNIGKRNHMALRKIFFRNNVMVDHENVGGNVNRTVKLDIISGNVRINISNRGEITV